MMSFILVPAAEIDDCSNHSNHSNHYVVEFGWMDASLASSCSLHMRQARQKAPNAVMHHSNGALPRCCNNALEAC